MAARAKGDVKSEEKADDKKPPVQLSLEERLARLSAKIDVAIPAPPAVPPANSVAIQDIDDDVEIELAPMSERMATAPGAVAGTRRPW